MRKPQRINFKKKQIRRRENVASAGGQEAEWGLVRRQCSYKSGLRILQDPSFEPYNRRQKARLRR